MTDLDIIIKLAKSNDEAYLYTEQISNIEKLNKWLNEQELDRKLVYTKLKAVCDYMAKGSCDNPLMKRSFCEEILSEWVRDEKKSDSFRLLCKTLLKTKGWRDE